MNLARVEYYLSDFLSVIETRDRKANGEIETDPLVDVDYYKDIDDIIDAFSDFVNLVPDDGCVVVPRDSENAMRCIKNFIKSKRAELAEMAKIPTPAEFEKYYNL